MRWVKMTEFRTKAEAKRTANILHKYNWAMQIRKHEPRLYNRELSRYTIMRSEEKVKK